ncbi:MAG: hypothetical protein N2450_09530 [bacterium]|nr:hypothetical protein [bacterium]
MIITIVLLLSDFIALLLSYSGAYLLRYESGLFHVYIKGDFFSAALLLSVSWLIVFAIFGHYKHISTELWTKDFKKIGITVLIGGLILFWLTYEAERPLPPGRFVLVAYGLLITFFVSTGRKGVYWLQKWMWKSGKSLANTAIIGYGKWVDTIVKELMEHKEYGEVFTGSIAINHEERNKLPPPILGTLNELEELIQQHALKTVILAWDNGHTEELLQTLLICNHLQVEVQVVPDLRDAAAGWTKLTPREDLPLFIVTDKFHPNWERVLKKVVGGSRA